LHRCRKSGKCISVLSQLLVCTLERLQLRAANEFKPIASTEEFLEELT
jgi:hypothetical protein